MRSLSLGWVWTIGSLPSNIHNRSLIWITSRHGFSRLSFRAYLSVYLRGCKTNLPRWWVVTLYFCHITDGHRDRVTSWAPYGAKNRCHEPVYICVFLKRIQPKSAGDDIRYTPHPFLAHFLRWVRCLEARSLSRKVTWPPVRGERARFTLPQRECLQWFTNTSFISSQLLVHMITLSV